ncbi:MAG: four helix bundle protein [Sandaracinaceae bacterium]|jgi:hypothetical protein|nr:four helix bundle protein [Sandaracinaceae bacterium]
MTPRKTLRSLRVLDVTIDAIQKLAPVVRTIRSCDSDLADQIRRAASSIALNLGEGNASLGGNRRKHFHIALGSTREGLGKGDVPLFQEFESGKRKRGRSPFSRIRIRKKGNVPFSSNQEKGERPLFFESGKRGTSPFLLTRTRTRPRPPHPRPVLHSRP